MDIGKTTHQNGPPLHIKGFKQQPIIWYVRKCCLYQLHKWNSYLRANAQVQSPLVFV